MHPNIKNIFSKIEKSTIQTDPFEHLVIDNLLPDDFYKDLAKEFNAEDFHRHYESGGYGNKERYGVDITNYSAWAGSGRKIGTTLHQDNYNSLLSRDHTNLEFFVNLLLKNEKDFYSLLSSKLTTERLQDNYFYHVSMIKDVAGYEVKAHPDNQQNIFTILFYTPETDINREFGLQVYKDGGNTPVAVGSSLPSSNRYLETAGEIDFLPNRMIIFAPSYPDESRPTTWHSVHRVSNKLVGTRNSFQMFFYRNNK